MANQFTSRIGALPNNDNTGMQATYTYGENAYGATIAVTPAALVTYYNMDTALGVLTGNATINATVTSLFAGDVVKFTFQSDSTGSRVVTFGTGFKSTGTLTTTASKFSYMEFIFDGTNLIETGRVTATA